MQCLLLCYHSNGKIYIYILKQNVPLYTIAVREVCHSRHVLVKLFAKNNCFLKKVMFGNIFTHSSVFFSILVQSLAGFHQTCNTCGQIDFNVEQGVQDRFLDDGRNLATTIVKSDSECFVECSLDCRCISFSVCENSCQLSARSRQLVKISLRHKPGCRYYDFPQFEVSPSLSKKKSIVHDRFIIDVS